MLAKELDWANSPWFVVLCWAIIIVVGMVAFFLHRRRASASLFGTDETRTDDLCEIDDAEDLTDDPPLGNGDPWTVWCRKVKGDDDGMA